MGTINIKAILGVSPCKRPKPHFFVITRGATAELRYDLYSKWFRFSDLEQLTFTFKQNKKLYWFNMFDYFGASEDAVANADKTYYTVSPKIPGEKEVIAEPVTEYAGKNPHLEGWYELVNPADGQNNLFYRIDEKHFYREYNYADGYDYISLILSPEETKAFKSTSGEPSLLFETAVRINTDEDAELALHDSVIVEPHPSIVVADCLFSQID